MYEPKLSFIFPAFFQDYPEESRCFIPGFGDRFNALSGRAAELVSPGLNKFNIFKDHLPSEELETQYITYIYSCTLSDLLSERGIMADYVSGFSMGIYAAIRHARSISFEDGLELIRNAFSESARCLGSRRFAMGSCIGLDESDLKQMFRKNRFSLEITNQNSPCSFTFSGIATEVLSMLDLCREEGALHTRLLRCSVPYHSRFLKPASQVFSGFADRIAVAAPEIPVISQIDQVPLTHPGQIREELARNLTSPLNWMKTQQYLSRSGVNSFVEMGPGRNLAKNSRFIEGNARFYDPQKLVSEAGEAS